MEKDIIELNSELIENMIYVIRGKKVMLDFELAHIYGYDTRDFNNQVKHNIERFEKDFRFQLNEKEWNELLVWKKSTANNLLKRRTLPYAFTEQGIYMLMTVLKGDLAIKQSKALIRAFKQMKDYIVENKEVLSLNEGIKLTNLVNNHSNRLDIIESKLDVVMDNFIDPSKYKHFLIKDGQKIEADVAYQEIYKMAKKTIIIIDDYVDVKTLELLKVCMSCISIYIITDNKARNKLNTSFINDFKHDTGLEIKLIQNNDKFHDRYIVIDYKTNNYKLFHCGASSKDSGKSINTIMKIKEKELYYSLIEETLMHEDLII
ncbi:MAG: ORF6N domain-containing protein [Bacilli bacterium]|nr:ORF6N domain-containing protein [Bacilli bacterium]